MTEHRLSKEDELAVRARDGDTRALGELWRGRERDVHGLSIAVCMSLGKPHRREDAYEHAMAIFVFEAVPTYDEARGHFWPHAEMRIKDRLKRFLLRDWRRNDPPVTEDSQEEPHPPTLEASPEELAEFKDAATDLLEKFESPTTRNKWAVLQLLKAHGISLRKATDALALSSVGAADPVVEAVGETWEAIAGLWLRLDLQMEPPPLPATWSGCVELFCPHPADDAVPKPPSRPGLKDPTTRAAELHRWYVRVKRWYHRTTVEVLGIPPAE